MSSYDQCSLIGADGMYARIVQLSRPVFAYIDLMRCVNAFCMSLQQHFCSVFGRLDEVLWLVKTIFVAGVSRGSIVASLRLRICEKSVL